jgi:flagellar biogenesis protein FliO
VKIHRGLIVPWIVASAWLTPMAWIAPVALADAPGHEEHAGKPILRDDAFSQPAAASPAAGRPSFEPDTGRVVLALAGVICLILVLRYGTKKILPASMTAGRVPGLKVLARFPLAPRQQIVLLQVGQRIIVAADCASQLSTLCQITDADEVAALVGEIGRTKQSPASHPFTSWFSRATDAFTAEEHEAAMGEPHAANRDEGEESSFGQPERTELAGLSEKVRELVRQFGGKKPAE